MIQTKNVIQEKYRNIQITTELNKIFHIPPLIRVVPIIKYPPGSYNKPSVPPALIPDESITSVKILDKTMQSAALAENITFKFPLYIYDIDYSNANSNYVLNVEKAKQLVDNVFVNLDIEEITGNANTILEQSITEINSEIVRVRQRVSPIELPGWVNTQNILDYSVTGPKMTPQLVLPAGTTITASTFTGTKPTTTNYVSQALVGLRGTADPFYLNTVRRLAESVNNTTIDFSGYMSKSDFASQVAGLPLINFGVANRFDDLIVLANSLNGTAGSRFASIVAYQTAVSWSFDYILNAESIARSVILPRFSSVETDYSYIESKRQQLGNEVYSNGWVNSTRLSESLVLPVDSALPTSLIDLADSSNKIATTEHVKNVLLRDIYGSIQNIRTIQSLAAIVNSDSSYAFHVADNIAALNQQVADASINMSSLVSLDTAGSNVDTLTQNTNTQRGNINNIREKVQTIATHADSSMAWILSQTAIQSIEQYRLQTGLTLYEIDDKLALYAIPNIAEKLDASFHILNSRIDSSGLNQLSTNITGLLDSEIERLANKSDSSLAALYSRETANISSLAAAYSVALQLVDTSAAIHDASMSVEQVRPFSADGSAALVEYDIKDRILGIGADLETYNTNLTNIGIRERNVVELCDISLALVQFPSLAGFETRYLQTVENYKTQYGNVRFINDNSLYWFSLYVDAYDSYFKSRHVLADNSMISLDTGIQQSLREKVDATVARIVEPSFNDLAFAMATQKIDGSLNLAFQRDKLILENSLWRRDTLDLSLNNSIERASNQDSSINTVFNRAWTSLDTTVLPAATEIISVDASSHEVVSTSWTSMELVKTAGIVATSLDSLVELANAINMPIQSSSVGGLLGDISTNLHTQEARLDGLNSSGLGTFNVDASLAHLLSKYSVLESSANRVDSSLNHFILKTDGSLASITAFLVWPESWVSSFDSSFARLAGKPVPQLSTFDSSYSSLFERNSTQTADLVGLYNDASSIFPVGYFDRFDLSGIRVSSTGKFETWFDSSLGNISSRFNAADSSISLVNSGIRSYLAAEIEITIPDYNNWINTTGLSLEIVRTNTGPWTTTDSSLVILSGIATQTANSFSNTTQKYTDASEVATTNGTILRDLSQNAWIQTMNSSVVLPANTSVASGTDSAHPQSTGYVKTAIAGLISNAPTGLNTLNKLAAALEGNSDAANTIQNRLQILDTSLGLVDYRSRIESLDASFTQALPQYTARTSQTHAAIEHMRVNDISTNLAGGRLATTNSTYNSSNPLSLATSGKIGTVDGKFANADSSLNRIPGQFSTVDNSYIVIDVGLGSEETLSLDLVPKIQSNDISTNLLAVQTSQKETDIYNLFQLFTKITGVSGTPTVNSIVVGFNPPLAASSINVLLYKIYVSGGGSNYVVNIANTTTSYEVAGLSQDTTYSIYVEAVTEYITTSSSTISVKTLMGGVSNLRATANTTTSITVAYDANAGATSYNWTAVPDLNGISTRSGSVSSGTTSIPITGLTSGAVYTISIVANGANGSSLPTTIVYGTLLVAPSITGTDNTTSSIRVSVVGPSVGTVSKYTWTATAAGFTTRTGEFAAGTTLADLTGLDSGVVYSISVVAVGLYGVSAGGTATYGTRLLAPTSLTATGNTTTTISISFTGPSVGTITKHTWTAVPDIAVATLTGDLSGNITSTTITGMTSGAIYTISVVAVGLYGTSAASNSLVYGTVLPAPSGVSATPTANSITLNWSMAANVSQNVAKYSYTVYQSSTLAASGDVSSNIFTAVASGLTGATSYTAGVYAANTYGNSATSSVAVNTLVEAPTNLSATSTTSTSITVSFTRPSGTFTRFDWRARPTAGGTTLTGNFTTAGSSGTITGLSAGVEYGLSLAAIGTFSSDYSSELIWITTLDAPTGLSFTARDVSSITFGWNAVSGATSYNVGAKSITLGTEITKTTATNSVVMDGLASGRIYDLSVAAVGTYGASDYSTRLRESTTLVLTGPLNVSNISASTMSIGYPALEIQDCSYVLRTIPNVLQHLLAPGTTSYTLSRLEMNTSYNIILDASNIYTTSSINITQSTNDILSTLARNALNAAYSVYLVNTDYTGPCLKIRRSSDSVIADFYPDINGNLGTDVDATGTSYTTWIGASTGFVVTWYDQSGKNRYAIQNNTALQPTLDYTNKLLSFNNSRLDMSNGTIPFGNSAYTTNYRHGTISTATRYHGIYGSGTFGVANKSNNARIDTSANLYFHYWWSNDFVFGTSIQNNRVTETYDPSLSTQHRKGYVNGILANTRTNTAIRSSDSINNRIGEAHTTSERLVGQLYHLLIFADVLYGGDLSVINSIQLMLGTQPPPSGLTFIARDVSSITFGWNAVSGATSYNVGAKSITLGTEITKTAATNSVVMDGLASGRIYDLFVAAVTPYATGPRSANLRNSTSIVLPTDLSATNITTNDSIITYTALAAQDCSYVLRTVPNTTQSILSPGSTSQTLSELTPLTNYTVYLDASNTYISPAVNISTTFSTKNIINLNLYKVTKADGINNTNNNVSDSDLVNIGSNSGCKYMACDPSMQRIVINPAGSVYLNISSDSGKTFQISSSYNSKGSVSCMAVSESTQYIYTFGFTDISTNFYRSSDYGFNFTKLTLSFSRGPANSILCSNDGSKVVTYENNSGKIYLSNDYGTTFIQIKNVEFSITFIYMSSNTKYIAVYSGRRIVIGYNINGINNDSTNISETIWTDRTYSTIPLGYIFKVNILDNGLIFIPKFASNQTISYITYDNFINSTSASSWSNTASQDDNYNYYFSQDGNTIIVTSDTAVYTSANRGINWNVFNISTFPNFSTYSFDNMVVNKNNDRVLYSIRNYSSHGYFLYSKY